MNMKKRYFLQAGAAMLGTVLLSQKLTQKSQVIATTNNGFEISKTDEEFSHPNSFKYCGNTELNLLVVVPSIKNMVKVLLSALPAIYPCFHPEPNSTVVQAGPVSMLPSKERSLHQQTSHF
jgi:hypothetical protein